MNFEKRYSVYKLTSPDNKVYIGCTSQDPKERWNYGSKYHHNEELSDDIQKNGWKNFEHEILYSDLYEEEAYELERKLIREYDSCNPEYGYNKTHGGKTNPGIIRSDDYRKKLSERTRGEKHHFYGKHLSDEHRQKISKSNQGHVVSAETRRKIGDANRDRNKRKVVCVETGVCYESVKEAGIAVNTPSSNISSVCTGKTKTAAGYHWAHADAYFKSKEKGE